MTLSAGRQLERLDLLEPLKTNSYRGETDYAATAVLRQVRPAIIGPVDEVINLIGHHLWVQFWEEIDRIKPKPRKVSIYTPARLGGKVGPMLLTKVHRAVENDASDILTHIQANLWNQLREEARP